MTIYLVSHQAYQVDFSSAKETAERKSRKESTMEVKITPRPSKDQYYCNIAEAVLERSTCLRRKYGAVIVKNDIIISTGYNGSVRGEPNC